MPRLGARPSSQPASSRATVGLPAAFEGLPGWTLEQLARHGQLLNLRRGTVLQEEGQAAPTVVAIQAGLVCTTQSTQGATAVITDFLKPGELLMPGLREEDVAECAVHSITAAVVWSWPRDKLRSVLTDSPPLSLWVVQQLIERQHKLRRQHALNQSLSLEALYARFLWDMSEPIAAREERLMPHKISQQMVASYLQVTREELSRRKQLLEKAGYILPVEGGLQLSAHLPVLFA